MAMASFAFDAHSLMQPQKDETGLMFRNWLDEGVLAKKSVRPYSDKFIKLHNALLRVLIFTFAPFAVHGSDDRTPPHTR
jgi:hypothetical protein